MGVPAGDVAVIRSKLDVLRTSSDEYGDGVLDTGCRTCLVTRYTSTSESRHPI